MKGMFEATAKYPYNLRCISEFSTPLVSLESIFSRRPKIWSLLPETFKNIDSLGISKYQLRSGNLKIALVDYARSI